MKTETLPQNAPRPFLAWIYLVQLSLRRQARARLMVWVAVGLLLVSTLLVLRVTLANQWGMGHWHFPRRRNPTIQEYLDAMHLVTLPFPLSTTAGVHQAVLASWDQALLHSGFFVFTWAIVFSLFATFLLPLWSLSFATEALGRDREAGNLIWILARPISRPGIYLATFLACLPWSLALNMGGFAILCWAGGETGLLAFQYYWPAVLLATMAFCSLFHLMGICFRRPAIVAILYSFFLESFVGNLPGFLKRASISYYARCMMFDAGKDFGILPQDPSIFLPVSGTSACLILAGFTGALLLTGMFVFSRNEYLDQG